VIAKGAKFVIVTNASRVSEFFAELDAEGAKIPDDLEKIVGIATRYGFTFPPPPQTM